MKNKSVHFVLFLLALLSFVACSGELTREDIQEKYTSGVVAVRNRYYYKVQLVGGHTFWFVPSPDAMTDIRFYANENEVRKQIQTTYGSGFFVTKDGVIVTHNQVVSLAVNSNDVCRALANQLSYLKQYYAVELELYVRRLALVKDGFETLEQERMEALGYVGGNLKMRADLDRDYLDRRNKLTAMQTDFQLKTDSLKGIIRELDHYNNSQVRIYPVQQLEAACLCPDNKSFSDWKSCTLEASNPKVGLAVIRLNSKQTPDNCHVFELTSDGFFASFLKKDNVKGPLFVLGIERNEGDLSRFRPYVFDEKAVSEGNWGSPVLDKYGKLVGINASDTANGRPDNPYIKIKNLFQLVKVNYN